MTDTIYALSSGAGMAAIAIVRASGPAAGVLLDDIAGPRPGPRQASRRVIRDPVSHEVIDHGIVLWFPGPKSATAEDLCEFHVHGSPAVIDGLFALLNRYHGVRPAEPGEFTRRAFANGQMDLVEIEGLADLLKARTAGQRRLAVHHLMGDASSIYDRWRHDLVGILARVEAAVDFSDEEDIAASALNGLSASIGALASSMREALQTASQARAIRDGIRVVLAGLPNTGKSSLLNTLANRDVAIVSSMPGTTRDVIEVMIDLDGLPVVLTDTAGLREHVRDDIERMGIARTQAQLQVADIVIWVSSSDIAASSIPPDGVTPDLVLLNKADLLPNVLGEIQNGVFPVSSVTGAGIAAMVEHLTHIVRRRYGSAEMSVVVRARQSRAIEESIRHLNNSLRHGFSNVELVAEDLRKSAHCLARVTGRIDVEDLLETIFAEFCIGK